MQWNGKEFGKQRGKEKQNGSNSTKNIVEEVWNEAEFLMQNAPRPWERILYGFDNDLSACVGIVVQEVPRWTNVVVAITIPKELPWNFLEGPLSSNPSTRLRQMLARPGVVASRCKYNLKHSFNRNTI